MKRRRTSLSTAHVYHLFLTMDGAIGAGSECRDDYVVRKQLARILKERKAMTSDAEIDRIIANPIPTKRQLQGE